MNAEHHKVLLRVARESVEAVVKGQTRPALPASVPLKSYGGAFVTLRTHGSLRGCMGTFSAEEDLTQVIQEVAELSARDPRFVVMPITAQELPDIRVEISILSTAQCTSNPLSLELGVHGILVEQGNQRGCFLPHVATEFGWTKEQFLSRCCQDKAALQPDAWKEPHTRISLFTAEVFAE